MPFIHNRVFRESETVVDSSVAGQETVNMTQGVFPLTEADYLRLRSPVSLWTGAAAAIFLASFGLVLGPVGKWLQQKASNVPMTIDPWEWYAPLVGVVASGVLWLIGALMPNERRELMKRMKAFFATAPKRLSVGRKRK
jgi:hypothetical protein